MTMASDHIVISKTGKTGIITLCRPDGLNILNTKMLLDLKDLFISLDRDEDVRVVIVTGEKNFCAGADLKEMKDKSEAEAEAFSRLGHDICNQIEGMGKPVIAAVRGYALGGGCEIAIACDLRIAGESSQFGQPEINIGLIPGFGATQRLARLIGIGRAKELILTGRTIDAKKAEAIGLANLVVKDDELTEKAEQIAEEISQKSPVTLKKAKMLLSRHLEISAGLREEIAAFAECFTTEDHLEGIRAFIEKRRPQFKGR